MSEVSAPVSRNPYVERLNEFNEIALAGRNVGNRRGSWREFFGGRMSKSGAPERIVLEVGCSNGYFLDDIAKDHQSTAFVGLDWKYKLIYKACKKSESYGLKNTAFIRGRGQDLTQVFAPGEVDEIWVFFPDPWPKAAQQKHRLLQEKFFLDAHQILSPSGRIFIKTDHPGYFEWILAVLGQHRPVDVSMGSVGSVPSERNKRSRQFLHRTLENKDLPPASEAVMERLEVTATSTDFWNDPNIGALKPPSIEQPMFWGRNTLFEGLFRKDALPVHYIGLGKRK